MSFSYDAAHPRGIDISCGKPRMVWMVLRKVEKAERVAVFMVPDAREAFTAKR